MMLAENDMTGVDWRGLLERPAALGQPITCGALHKDECVLITGAGGSIGSVLAVRLAELQPALLLLLDISEQNLYEIDTRLQKLWPRVPCVAIAGSIEDESLLNEVCACYHPQTVYHTAAYKHVPLMEANPLAVVRNNTLGTYRLVQAALRHSVEHLLMVSTDKAVRPSSMMGASKRMAELALLASSGGTRINSVRLGNVLGSKGSVVQVFLEQIARGENVTVTHPDAHRFFFTMEETVSLILKAGSDVGDRRVFIPEIEHPTRIVDLATYLIGKAGKSAESLRLVFTGLRPGEKLVEEFIGPGEHIVHAGPHLHAVFSPAPDEEHLRGAMLNLDAAVRTRNLPDILRTIQRLVPEYCPSPSLDRNCASSLAGSLHD
ncbi:MAG: polysaccharide biosynthesis protein [Acidobacteriaceae bacterium]